MGLEIRPATADDDGAVLDLLAMSLRWVPDELHARFFEWKHRENPFGPSLVWLALVDGVAVGYRTFLRWELLDGDRIVRAVRAVDTATHPDHRRGGVFSTLTAHAVEAARLDGVDLIFNTPNEASLPGYLKLGWEVVGRPPVGIAARSPGAVMAALRSRVAADKWSQPTEAGVAAADVLADAATVASLLDVVGTGDGLATRRSHRYLLWRYGFEPLAYRAVVAPTGPADGVIVFRVRRRGVSTEVAVVEMLWPDDDRRGLRRALASILRQVGRAHLIAAGPGTRRAHMIPAPRQGPVLTWRPLVPRERPRWGLTLGDIELM